ncbi:hypothetical protein ACE1CD_15460 [Aerosakkonema sp. BLCC-F183]|uniref:hypothetical protein n=1 Tax=Aerosakkonema sp. BLCC-F183 TaxID=3342834 RepID=UPI0035B729B8
MSIKQWNEAAGILRPEYEIDEPEISASELQNQCAMLLNVLVSAQYQIDNLNNPIIDRKTRIVYIKRFLEQAIDLTNAIRKEMEIPMKAIGQ